MTASKKQRRFQEAHSGPGSSVPSGIGAVTGAIIWVMCESDTTCDSSDTLALDVAPGDKVRVVAERLEIEGVVIGSRPLRRLLIRIGTGVFIEVSRFCVELVARHGVNEQDQL